LRYLFIPKNRKIISFGLSDKNPQNPVYNEMGAFNEMGDSINGRNPFK
jgi:hypothetical protein